MPLPQISRREVLAMLGAGAAVSHYSACSSAPTTNSDAGDGPLHYASLREVARLVESKQLSPVELTQMMLDRRQLLRCQCLKS